MTSIVILGGEGFIGRRVSALFCQLGHSVYTVEPRSAASGSSLDLDDRVVRLKGSASERERLVEIADDVSADSVINLAYARGLSIADEMDVMCAGIWNTLEAARLSGASRVTLASSIRVYGPQFVHGDEVTLNESSPCLPVTRYGHYKLLGERLASDYREQYRLQATALRIPLVYGSDIRRGAFDVALPAISAANRTSAVMTVDPAARQCLAHVEDVARALVSLADPDMGEPDWPIYELGGVVASYRQMVEIATRLEPSIQIRFEDSSEHPEYDFAYRVDGSRLAAEYGISHRSLEEGYEEVIAEARERSEESTVG